jgi:pilus assembly protein Flp/PilA
MGPAPVKGKNMIPIFQRVGAFLKQEDGPTSVEYAIMLALIIALCITAITNLGVATRTSLENEALRNTLAAGGS